jgi:hypothetical protein
MDDSAKPGNDRSRRDFLEEMAALPIFALLGGQPAHRNAIGANAMIASAQPPAASVPPGEKFVAIQIGARSFVDEGVEGALDTLQEKAGVNVVMPAVFTYGRGLAGRQIPGLPLPDHGGQQYDEICRRWRRASRTRMSGDIA